MIKMNRKLLELERIACVALRSRGATVGQVAIAPIATPASDTNWMLLHVDGERAFDRMFEELIRPIKAQYDLSW
jgi:acetolactate synthase regulatory subunit